MQKQNKKFEITARIVVITSISVVADSMEEAVVQAKELKETDFITVDGEYLDGSIRITGVSSPDSWKTDDN